MHLPSAPESHSFTPADPRPPPDVVPRMQVNLNQYELSSITQLTLTSDFVGSVSVIYDAVNNGTGSQSLNVYLSNFLQVRVVHA